LIVLLVAIGWQISGSGLLKADLHIASIPLIEACSISVKLRNDSSIDCPEESGRRAGASETNA